MKQTDSVIAKKGGGWSDIRQNVKDWTKPALVALVKDLYFAFPDNRNYLHARFQAEENSGLALEKYRLKIIEQFFPARGFGKLKLGEARKAIRDYRKATNNLDGTIDLMLTYVENGTKFTHQFGDITASFYDSLESVLGELSKLFLEQGKEFYPRYRDRVLKLTIHAHDIGWGYGDYLIDTVHYLENELVGEPPISGNSEPET